MFADSLRQDLRIGLRVLLKQKNFCTLAVTALALGICGVMNFSVNQRTSEFGIRMALGADSTSILAMVLRQGSVQLVLGLGLALLIATLGGQGIQNALSNMNSPPAP